MKQKLKNAFGGDKLILIAATVVVFAMFTLLNRNFLSWTNFVNILGATSLVGLVAIGHTYLIIAGQNDLSPGSLAAFSGVLAALLVSQGMNLYLSFLITILAGALIGVFNAFMVNRIKLQAFIATLVTQSIVRGFAYILCDGRPIAIGGNESAARLAGLNPRRIVLLCFVMMGMMCAIGGIVFAARMNSGQPAANVNLEFDAITAVILGGVSFTGGVGTMGGTIIGVFLIQAFNTGLTMVNVPSFWQYVAKGALLLFALTSDYIRKQNRERQLLEASKKNG